MSCLIHRIIGRQRKQEPERDRELEPDPLKISATSGRPMPLFSGVFLVRVSMCRGGSVSPDTSDYRTPEENGPDRQRKLEPDCLEIPVARGRPVPIVSGIFLAHVCIFQGCSVSNDTSNYMTPKQNGTDRPRQLGPDCLEISVTHWRYRPLGFGIFLIRVRIYQNGSVAPYTSNYRMSQAKRARSTAETGTRLSGNIIHVLSPHAIRLRDVPYHCMHLPGRFCLT